MLTVAVHGMKQSNYEITNRFLEQKQMKKTPDYKPTRLTMIQHLIEYQISLIDKTIVDTLENENWHSEWSINQAQYNDLEKYSISIIRKTFRCSKAKGLKTFKWFYDVFGLQIK